MKYVPQGEPKYLLPMEKLSLKKLREIGHSC
jgi:hypothetical protein